MRVHAYIKKTNLIPGARVGKGDSGTLPEAEELDGGDVVPSADMAALRQLCNVTGGLIVKIVVASLHYRALSRNAQWHTKRVDCKHTSNDTREWLQ